MKKRTFQFHDGKSGAAVALRVTTAARRTTIDAILEDGTISVSLAAPEERANDALLVFFSQVVKVLPAQLELVAGANGQDKLVTILGLDGTEVESRIRAWMRA
jgi:uncharacterized protein YggU (UPF0235/DUF167 family)